MFSDFYGNAWHRLVNLEAWEVCLWHTKVGNTQRYIELMSTRQWGWKLMCIKLVQPHQAGPSSSDWFGCTSDWYSGGHGFDPQVWQHSFLDIGHKIISMAISSRAVVMQLLVKGCALSTVNFLNIRTPKKFVVITLKFGLCGSTIE